MGRRASKRMGFRILVVLSITIGALPFAIAAPKRSSEPSVCVPTCKQSRDAKLNYAEGQTYVYNFQSESTTSIVGATDESKTLKIRGEALIAAHSSCDLVLSLRNVVAVTPSGQEVLVEDHSSPARFALQNDGAVEGLCLRENSTSWYSNLQRSIISMLENRADKNQGESLVTETDISGACQTQYQVRGNTYVKTRNLNSCTHREGGNSLAYGVPYDVVSKRNSLPGVESTLTCEQTLQDGIYSAVTCEETHKLKPFSHNQAGAQTVVRSSLNLVSTNAELQGPEPSKASKPASIYFDHSDSTAPQSAAEASKQVRALLTELCPEIAHGVVSAKVPSIFLQLRKAAEFTQYEDLKALRDEIVSKKMCKSGALKMDKLFLDAAAMSAGDGAIALLAELYPGEELSDETKGYFHIYTAFATRPGPVALDAMEKLLENPESFGNTGILLAASGLGYQYCTFSNPKCGQNDAYVALVNQIARQASTSCASKSPEDMEQAVVALQALGNLNHLPSEAVNAITRCMEGPERLQVRALDASRRDPCNRDLKEVALRTFANRAADTDVRIVAYISASKCLQESDVERIQKTLDEEKSNQVLSFVASHIHNQQRGSEPEAHSATRSLLRQLQLPRDAPKDMRKYSRNYQLSTFSPVMNLGGAADANIIFSPHSYIPRISSANMTLHAFGRSYNFLQLGLYTENLEHAAESYFGPSGKLRRTSFQDLVKDARNRVRDFANSFRTSPRSDRTRRSANPFLDDGLVSLVHDQAEQNSVLKKRFNKHGIADLYIRVMGTSVLVNSVSSGHLLDSTLKEAIVEEVENLAAGAKNHKVDLTQPIPLINDQVSIPTMAGLPINFDVQGSTILSLQMSGNLDVDQLLFTDEPSNFHGKIAPSAATTLIGRMTTGKGLVEVGVELEGKVHSASSVEIKVEKEKEKFDLQINLPVEKQQILDVRTNLFWTEEVESKRQDEKKALKTPVTAKTQLRSYADPNNCRISEILGLQLCTDARFPVTRDSSPYFPLSGPSVISVALQKTEPSMKGYQVQVLTNLSDETKQSVSVLFDTPGSTTNRKIDAKVKYIQEPFTKLELDVDSPWKKFSAFYEKQVGENVKSIDIAYLSEDDQYSGKAELKMATEGHKRIFEPLLQYVTPAGEHKLLQGKLEVHHGKKVKLDLKTDSGNLKALSGEIKAEMEEKSYNGGHKYEITTAELDFPSWNVGQLKLSGDITVAQPTFGLNLVTQYGQSAQTLSLDSTFTHVKKQRAALDAHLKSSALPGINFDLLWNATIDQQTDALEHRLYFAQGRESDRLTIRSHSLIDTRSRKLFHVINELEITRPTRNVDLEFKMHAKKMAGKSQAYNMTLRSGETYRAELGLRSGPDALFDYNLQGVLQYPGQYFEVTETARKSGADSWRYDTQLNQNPGANYTAVTKLVLRNERNNVQNALETTINSAALSSPIVFKCGFLQKPTRSSAYMVLNAQGEPQVDILTSYKQAGTKPEAVDVTALVKPYVSMNLSETHTRSSSKLNLKFKWLPTERLITLDSLLKLQDQLTLDGTLKWDAERDESKTAVLKSVTNFGVGWYIDTTNDITIEGKTSNIRMKGKLAKDVLNGEHLLDVNYRNPENQNLGVYILNKMESRSKFKSSDLKAKLQVFNSEPYELDWENKLANIDTERLTVEAMTDMKVSYGSNKNLKLQGEFNSLSTNKRTLNGHFALSGSALSNALAFDYNTEWKPEAFKVNLKGNYGAKVTNVELNGQLNKINNRKIADLAYKITTPVQPKSVEGTVQYGYFFNSWRNFEVTEAGSVAFNNGIPSTWSNLIKRHENEFQAASQIIREGSAFIDYGINGRRDKKRFVLGLHGLYQDRGARFFTNIDGQFPYYNVRANGSLKLSAKSNDFKLYHRSGQGGQSVDTDLTVVRATGARFVLTNKLENFPKRKSIDLLFTDGSTPRKVYMLVTENNTPRWSLDSYVKWGEGGKALATKGALELGKSLMDVVLSLDSPALNINKWSARASRKLTNGRESVALDVEGKNEKVVSVGLNYAAKETGALLSYDGTLRVETKKGQNFNGNFRVEKSLFDRKRNNEEGQQIKASFDLLNEGANPLKLELLTKSSDIEKKLALSMCREGGKKCQAGEVMLFAKGSANEEAEYVVKATARTVEGDQKKIDGVVIETRRSADRKNFEHSAKLILGQDVEHGQLGYRMYRSDGKEVGFEVQLPERLLSAIAVAERSRGHDRAEISVWMDKKRKPEDKMSALFSLQDVSSDDHAHGTEMLLQVHHHALLQDLKLKQRIVSGGKRTILDLVTQLDVFKKKGELVFGVQITKDDINGGHLYRANIGAKSPNPELNLQINSNLTRTRSEMALTTDFAYETRDKAVKQANLNVQYSNEHASLTFGPASYSPSVLFSTNWNQRGRHGSAGYDVRYEFLIPGMADARIVESQLHPSIPPHANIKMYTATTPDDQYYEAFIGFKSNKQFAAGMYHQIGAERNVIGDFNLALNSSRLLLVKADWEPKTIEKTLNDAQERLRQTGEGFKTAFNSTLNDATNEIQSLIGSLDDSLPELEPIAQAYSNEFKQMREELKNSEETQTLMSYVEEAENALNNSTVRFMEAVDAAAESLSAAAGKLSERLGGVPEVFKNLGTKFPHMMRTLTNSTESAVDALVEGSSKMVERVSEMFQNMGTFDGYSWEFLNETTSGIGKFMHATVNYTIDAASTTYEYAKNAGAQLMENTWVKNFVTNTVARYENLLADLIEELKNQLEKLRESMLSSFPQQEAQDFILALFEYAEKKARGTPVDDEKMRAQIYDKFVAAVKKAGSELYTVDLQNGLVLAQVPLPKPIDSLSDFDQLFILDFPKWNLHFRPSRPYSYGLSEFYNFLRADSVGSLIHRMLFGGASLHPSQSVGLLVGSQYFRTFDGRFYNFEGNCEYLLASDFVDKNFTIAVDFETRGGRVQKSILVNYQGDSAIIRPDFSTELRSARSSEQAVLSATENNKGYVTVKSSNGALEITCARREDVCVFAIDGYYHGKTMGLLGTNNNEEHDDFSGPQGNVVDDANDFVASWKLDGECSESPVSPHPENASRHALDACKSVFRSKWSPLRSCYEAVDPVEFQSLCESLSTRKGYDTRRAVCSTSVAYKNICAASSITVHTALGCE